MNFSGIIIGVSAFLIIGVFHPIVIKTEYYFGKKVWPVFLFVGVILIGASIGIDNIALSSITGIIGFSSLWSIHELIEQEQRVRKGWFPKNPNKKQGRDLDDIRQNNSLKNKWRRFQQNLRHIFYIFVNWKDPSAFQQVSLHSESLRKVLPWQLTDLRLS